MFRNYLVTAWRNIVKNGMFSLINILGLTLGLMSCILIMLFVREEIGFDTWLKDNDRIVRMHTSYSIPNQPIFETVRSAGRMMPAIRDYGSNEIATGVRLIPFGITVQKDGEGFSERAFMVDGSFFEVFDLPLKYGSKASSFNKPMDLIISEAMAIKYFGKSNVVGETLTICCVAGKTASVTITGVLENLPEASHLDADMIVYLQPALFAEDDSTLHTWTSVNVYTYFKLNAGISIDTLQTRINYWMNAESPLIDIFTPNRDENSQVTDFVQQRLMSVTDLHLHARKHAGSMGDLTSMGDINMINTFIVVAILVLLIACINFMNLSTAKASKRAKEVAMRKVLGATRAQVAIQFLGEAIAIVFISLLFALAAVEIVLPFYNQVLGKNLVFKLFEEPELFFTLVMLTLVVGIGAGIYPALYLSRFLPGHILKSSKSAESGSSNKLRTLLVVFQFTTSIVLVISTLVVYGQTVYVNNKDVGYQSDNKLVLSIRGVNSRESLKHELLAIPEVTSVVFSSEAPSQDNENNGGYKLLESTDGETANESLVLNSYNMGYGFFEAYQVKPMAGRLFNESFGSDTVPEVAEGELAHASAIINESTLLKLGIKSAEQAIGKTIYSNHENRELMIIGVIPNLYFRSIKFAVRASIYTLDPHRFRVATISYKSQDLSTLMQDVEAVWKNNVPMRPIYSQFLSEMMKAQYDNELTTAQLFLAFSALAILVATLGLFGLSAFIVERRTKEIGIRKVMGASVKDIVALLIWQFSKPVVVASFIAWPIACYSMLNWLEAFPYRIDTLWLVPICLTVSLFSLLIAWITVGSNAAKVARKNPVSSLRYE
ncbi:MAG: ABC transporter permease [Colwellia sp.]